MSKYENVDSALRHIRSSREHDEARSAYAGTSDAMKHTGTPTNNMLLSMVHSETKRNCDETMRLASATQRLADGISEMNSNMSSVLSLLEIQNELLSGIALGGQQTQTEYAFKTHKASGSKYYYQGVGLSSRNHVYACIIFHLIDMVQVHMDASGKVYPDSVDCDFRTMTSAIRVVCSMRCSIPTVEYKNTIETKKVDSQQLGVIYPYISSENKDYQTTLSESMLHRIITPITRPVIQEVEWIRQRLCHLTGVLSVKQTDILKSIRSPLIKTEAGDELNWDPSTIRPKQSHPLVREVSELSAEQKWEYIRLIMRNSKMQAAFDGACNFKK